MRIGDLPVRDARVWTCAPVWPRSARSVSAYATRARAQRRLRSATPIGQEHAPAVAPPTTARGASRVAPLRLQIQQSTRAAPSALLHPRGATLSPETAPSRSNRQHEWPLSPCHRLWPCRSGLPSRSQCWARSRPPHPRRPGDGEPDDGAEAPRACRTGEGPVEGKVSVHPGRYVLSLGILLAPGGFRDSGSFVKRTIQITKMSIAIAPRSYLLR